MRGIRYRRGNEFEGDMQLLRQQGHSDNSDILRQISRKLHKAIYTDLSARQQQVLTMYYYDGFNIPQIARMLGVNRSTVSRTLSRGENRLRRVARYMDKPV